MTVPLTGALLNSALYLVSVMIAGLFTQSFWATKCAIAAMGLTYLSYLTRATWEMRRTEALMAAGSLLTWLSITVGTGAGILLLFGV